mgnify:CR=1 FL=1
MSVKYEHENNRFICDKCKVEQKINPTNTKVLNMAFTKFKNKHIKCTK